MNRFNLVTRRTLFGIFFGAMFPFLATFMDVWLGGLPFSLGSALAVQIENPIHWIVDTAPIILGIAFHLVGEREAALSETNSRLQALIDHLQKMQVDLEARVEERTRELKAANAYNVKRAQQFEAIAQTVRSMRTLQTLSELLPQICDLISSHFGYYHVGVFLLDDENKNANLYAANSPGGKRMLKRGHKLKVGQEGIVGFVTSTGNARIALDTGQDSYYFDNPDLPDTHSELALPLKIGNRIIGALDVQSTATEAFANEDIANLSILADQVSIAIQNAQQYEATLNSLEQSRAQYQNYIQSEWSRQSREESLIGYQYKAGSVDPLKEPVEFGDVLNVIKDGKIFQRDGANASDTAELAIPVRLRGETIGVLSVSLPGKRNWTEDDVDIVEAVSDRLALAMENARLFQSTTKRAERERIVSNIASKISGNLRMENLLETTAQELSQALNGSEVLIQLRAAAQDGGRE